MTHGRAPRTMLLDRTTTAIAELAESDPKGQLDVFREEFRARARAHLRYERGYRTVYYLCGGVSVLLAVVVGAVDGCANPDLVTAMSVVVALLTTALNFFGIEAKLQQHETSKRQYELLCQDIERWLLSTDRDDETARDLEQSCFSKHRIISQAEPDLSSCCERKRAAVGD